MADTAELKHMVMSFRVSELQVLLGYAGRNKTGRKQELLLRCLALVEKGAQTAVQIKIKDLYRRRFPPRMQTSTSSSRPPVDSSPVKVQPPGHEPRQNYPNPGSAVSSSRLMDKKHSSSSSSSSSSLPVHNQMPVHPDVTLKHLPFYDVHDELLKPSSLSAQNMSRFQEAVYVFHLTPHQSQEIAMSRNPSGQYSVQVQLRFCLMETTCPQEDNIPASVFVRVCGKQAQLPPPIPTNKPGVEPKRPGRPINITPLCRISPYVSNQIQVSWASELGRNYCVAVYLVRKLDSDILLSRLKGTGVKHKDHTRALIKEKLAVQDHEIATTSLRVSLHCPLGKMRMTVPSRASTCTHLQTFDAPMFIQMNEKKPTWICPVCDKPAVYSTLVVDGYFMEILSRAPRDCGEVEFLEDGNWRPMQPKDRKKKTSSQPAPTPTTHTIDDTPVAKKDRWKPPDSPPTAPPPKPAGAALVDLTETDESDNEGPAPFTLASSSSSDSGDDRSNLSVISSTPPAMPSLSPMGGVISAGPLAASNTGCVSPPSIISIDTPPPMVSLDSHSPMARYSAYSSPIHHLSPSSYPRSSPLPQPPPAHSKNHSSSGVPRRGPYPAHSNNVPSNNSLFPSLPLFPTPYSTDSLSDHDFEEILNMMSGPNNRPTAPPDPVISYPQFSSNYSALPLTRRHNEPDEDEPMFPSRLSPYTNNTSAYCSSNDVSPHTIDSQSTARQSSPQNRSLNLLQDESRSPSPIPRTHRRRRRHWSSSSSSSDVSEFRPSSAESSESSS